MGLPKIDITFETAAGETIARLERGVVGVIVKDSAAGGGHTLTDEQQIPAGLGADNRAYVQNAFIGYVNRPGKVLLYVLEPEAASLAEALAWFGLQVPDYLVGPADCTADEAGEIAAWVGARRQENKKAKAVLPGKAADNEAIINFVTEDIKVGARTYAPAAYCSRMAGLIAGTPLTISCTYAPVPEVEDVKRLTAAELDAAVDEGKLILFHDGKKVKVGRGVNSLVTTTQGKGSAFKKIKIVETLDTIQTDVRLAIADSYIGKYANSYDNKCLLMAAIKGYFESLEQEGALKEGSLVEIDMGKQRSYLAAQGIDVSAMSDLAIKKADTGDKVFLKATIKILDAIEDVDLSVSM